MSLSPEVLVVFTVPEKRLSGMDVATGPCVAIPQRKRASVSAHNQEGSELPEQTAGLYTVLTGNSPVGVLNLCEERENGSLFKCSDSFVRAMADANRLLVRLADQAEASGGDLSDFERQMQEWSDAWMRTVHWPASQVSLRNRLMRMGKARIAQEKTQPLFCWYGPRVPEFVVVRRPGPNLN